MKEYDDKFYFDLVQVLEMTKNFEPEDLEVLFGSIIFEKCRLWGIDGMLLTRNIDLLMEGYRMVD